MLKHEEMVKKMLKKKAVKAEYDAQAQAEVAKRTGCTIGQLRRGRFWLS